MRPNHHGSLKISGVRIIAALAGAAALSMSGCDSDTTVCPSGFGEMNGWVTAGGKPASARMALYSASTESGIVATAYAYTDSTDGYYSVRVPAGAYRVRVEFMRGGGYPRYITADGFTSSQREAKLFDVPAGGSVRASAAFGSLEIRLHLPPEAEPAVVYAVIGEGDSRYGGADSVRAGLADIRVPVANPGRSPITVEMGTDTWQTRFWLPGTYRRSEAELYDVLETDPTVIEVTFPSAGALEGSVTGAWQEMGLGPPHVQAVDAEDPHGGGGEVDAIVAAGGAFRIPIFAPLRARIAIWEGAVRWVGGRAFEDARVFDLDPGHTVRVDVRDSGIAAAADSPIPEDSWVAVTDSTGHSVGFDDNYLGVGLFRIAGLAPGTYYMKLRARGFLDQWYDRSDSFEDATAIIISHEGEVVRITLHPVVGGSIRGRVLDPQGAPLIGVHVTMQPRRFISYDSVVAISGLDGDYDLKNLPDGDYWVIAKAKNEVWYPDAPDSSSAQTVTILHHSDVTGIDIRGVRVTTPE